VQLEADNEGSIARAAEALQGEPIDLLINNAGVLEDGSLTTTTKESLMKQFEVNAVGPFLVTRALLPNLKLASKNNGSAMVAHVSSYMGSIAKNEGGYYGYRASKTALNIINSSLAIDLKEEGIAAILLHPGYVVTDLTGGLGDVHTDESVAGMTAALDKATLADTGKFFHFQGQEIPW
jgi:NAD(P)-dependent dehydrogenase (short-subunit alcohol dehydrogenase family)